MVTLEKHLAGSATISTNCDCYAEDGYYADNEQVCLGECYELMTEDVDELLDTWLEFWSYPDTVLIEGKRIGWQRRSGYALIDTDDILSTLTLNGDYTLTLELQDNGRLTATRSSHDEPTGASFELIACSELRAL